MNESILQHFALRVLLFGGLISSSTAATTVFQTSFEDLTSTPVGESNDGSLLAGQTSASTVGSGTMSWVNPNNDNMVVKSGVFGMNTALVALGGTKIYGTLDTATQATINISDVVWFSIDMRTIHTDGTNRFGLTTSTSNAEDSATVAQRLSGIQARYTPLVNFPADVADATNNLPYTATGTVTNVYTDNADSFAGGQWTPYTTYTMVGKLTVDRSTGANETFQFWFLNQIVGAIDYENLGTPSVTLNTANLVEGSQQILGVVFDGNVGSNNYDNLTIAVPEPSVVLLGSVALLGLARRRRA